MARNAMASEARVTRASTMPPTLSKAVDAKDRGLVTRIIEVAFSLVSDEQDTQTFRGEASVSRVNADPTHGSTKYSIIVNYPTTVRLEALNLDDVWEAAPTHLTSVDLQATGDSIERAMAHPDARASAGTTRMQLRIGVCAIDGPLPKTYAAMRRMVRTFEVDRTVDDMDAAVSEKVNHDARDTGERKPEDCLETQADRTVAKAIILTILDMSQVKGSAFWSSITCLQDQPGMHDTFVVRWHVNKGRADTQLDPLVSQTIRARYGLIIKSIVFYVADKRDGTTPKLMVEVVAWRSRAPRCRIVDSRCLTIFSGQSDAARRHRVNVSGPMRHVARGSRDDTDPYQALVDEVEARGVSGAEQGASSVSQGGYPTAAQSMSIVPRPSARRRSLFETMASSVYGLFSRAPARAMSQFPSDSDVRSAQDRPKKRRRRD